MSLFELSFGLTSVVLGLALTHIAGAMRRLAVAGRKVRWSPEPLLLAGILLLVITFVWLDQWSDRGERVLPVGYAFLQVLKLLVLYFAASTCLPDVEPGQSISLATYFQETRRLTFGAMVVSLLLFIVSDLAKAGWQPSAPVMTRIAGEAVYAAAYGVLLFVRNRTVNIVVLSVGFVLYAIGVFSVRLS